MIIRNLPLTCFLLLTTTLLAQQPHYFNKYGKETDQAKADYSEKILSIDSNLFLIVKLNKNGDTLSTISCSSLDPIIRDGVTKLYYNNNKLHYLKSYSNNKLNNKLKRFYESGQMMSIVEFNRDSVLNKCSYDEKGIEIDYIDDRVLPKFMNKPIGYFRNYLLENFHYPEKAVRHDKTGNYKIEFSIAESGSVKDITISGDKIPEFENEIARVLKSTDGKWITGYLYGEPSEMKYNMTLHFSF